MNIRELAHTIQEDRQYYASDLDKTVPFRMLQDLDELLAMIDSGNIDSGASNTYRTDGTYLFIPNKLLTLKEAAAEAAKVIQPTNQIERDAIKHLAAALEREE